MKNLKNTRCIAIAIAAGLFAATPSAHAFEAGDWLIKLGAHVVNPKSDNGKLAAGTLSADIGSDVKPSIQAEYFFSPNLGLELLASEVHAFSADLQEGLDAFQGKRAPRFTGK